MGWGERAIALAMGLWLSAGAWARCPEMLARNLAIFLDPAPHFEKPGLTAEETRRLARLAYRFLTRDGTETSNMAHVADHLATLRRYELELLQAGIAPADVELAMLVHDLGKEYRHLPETWRTYIESFFPDVEKDFLGQRILAHEFASMLVLEELGREAGIDPRKIDRWKALIARHNAGYDPRLFETHFWVSAWKLLAARIDGIPAEYPRVLATDEGGSPVTVVLTAIDRGTSLTLASQEKFAVALARGGRWSNEALAAQAGSTFIDVIDEVNDVVRRLKPGDGRSPAAVAALVESLQRHFDPDLETLVTLERELPKMARAEGDYADGAALVAAAGHDSVVYKDRCAGRWHRVDRDGRYSFANADKTGWTEAEPGSLDGYDAATRLFRNAVFPDFKYRPKSMAAYAPR